MALAYDMVPRVEKLPEKHARKKGIITLIVISNTYHRPVKDESRSFLLNVKL